MNHPSRFLDLSNWPRREAFEYFVRLDNPYFNICTRLDVGPLRRALLAAGRPCSVMIAWHHLLLRQCQADEAMRYRLEGGRVRVHEVVHASTTVLRDDQSLGFALLRHASGLPEFARQARATIDAVHRRALPFSPSDGDTAVIHTTTVPWIHFTSFSHPRNWQSEDSIPKFAFGRFEADGDRVWMPMSVEVHHALLDGLHLGRFVQALEAELADPGGWMGASGHGA